MNLSAVLSNGYLAAYPAEAARLLEKVPQDELPDELQDLAIPALITALDYLSPRRAGEIFISLDAERRNRVLMASSPRLAVVLLSQIDEAERSEILAAVPEQLRFDLTRQLAFPEDTAGRLMDSVFTSVHEDMTVAEALDQLRNSRLRRARSLYVVDAANRLAAGVDMQDLALADGATPLRQLLRPVPATVGPLAPRQEIVDVLDEHRQDSLPVVDGDRRLMGVVRYTSLFRAIEAVATADLQKMVGNADERALSRPSFAVRRRLPWLHVNLVTAFLAATVVGLFENLIAQFTALAILLPVVAGESGNAGSQALAVTMRGLALREIGLRDWRKVLSKEVQVGLTNGIVIATVCAAGVLLWSDSLGLALVIMIAMVLAMLTACIAGAVLPILLTRAGQDPATASSIFLTMTTDITGFFAFLGTAMLLSGML